MAPLVARHALPSTAIALVLMVCPAFVSAVFLIHGRPSRWVISTQVMVYAASVMGLLWHMFVRRRFFNDMGWIFLLIGHASWFALPALYVVLRPGLWFGDKIGLYVPDQALVTAGFLIALFLTANGAGYHLIKRESAGRQPLITPSAFLVPPTHAFRLVLILLAAGLLPYIVFGGDLREIIHFIFLGRSNKPWARGDVIQTEGSALMTFFWVTRAFLISSGLLAGIYAVLGNKRRLTFAFVLSLVVVIIALDRGNRSNVAMTLVPVLVVFLSKKYFDGRGFRALRLALWSILVVAAMFAIAGFVQTNRYVEGGRQLSSITMSDVTSATRDTDFYTETANAVVVEQSLFEDINELPLLRFLINPIPRKLWPNKPVSMTQWHYTLYRWGEDIFKRGGNALPSVVGQYYMNFGIPGVIWGGLLFGMLAGWIERRLMNSEMYFEQVAAAAMGFTWLLMSFRFFNPGIHYSLLVLLVVVLFYTRLDHSRKHAHAGPSVDLPFQSFRA